MGSVQEVTFLAFETEKDLKKAQKAIEILGFRGKALTKKVL